MGGGELSGHRSRRWRWRWAPLRAWGDGRARRGARLALLAREAERVGEQRRLLGVHRGRVVRLARLPRHTEGSGPGRDGARWGEVGRGRGAARPRRPAHARREEKGPQRGRGRAGGGGEVPARARRGPRRSACSATRRASSRRGPAPPWAAAARRATAAAAASPAKGGGAARGWEKGRPSQGRGGLTGQGRGAAVPQGRKGAGGSPARRRCPAAALGSARGGTAGSVPAARRSRQGARAALCPRRRGWRRTAERAKMADM